MITLHMGDVDKTATAICGAKKLQPAELTYHEYELQSERLQIYETHEPCQACRNILDSREQFRPDVIKRRARRVSPEFLDNPTCKLCKVMLDDQDAELGLEIWIDYHVAGLKRRQSHVCFTCAAEIARLLRTGKDLSFADEEDEE